jgi:hypothetical protein
MDTAALFVVDGKTSAVLETHVFLGEGDEPVEGLGLKIETIDHRMDADRRAVALSDVACANGMLYLLFRAPGRIVVCERSAGDLRAVRILDYRKTELNPLFEYAGDSRMFGVMEGIAVGGGWIYMVADNNGRPLRRDSGEARPVLLRFKDPLGGPKGRAE